MTPLRFLAPLLAGVLLCGCGLDPSGDGPPDYADAGPIPPQVPPPSIAPTSGPVGDAGGIVTPDAASPQLPSDDAGSPGGDDAGTDAGTSLTPPPPPPPPTGGSADSGTLDDAGSGSGDPGDGKLDGGKGPGPKGS